MTVALTLCAVTGRFWGFFAAFLLGGLFYSPLVIIRNLALQHRLPENVWATGFSLLYAAGGLGHGAAALLTAALVDATTPAVTIVVCTALTTPIGLIAGLGERTGTKKTDPAPREEAPPAAHDDLTPPSGPTPHRSAKVPPRPARRGAGRPQPKPPSPLRSPSQGVKTCSRRSTAPSAPRWYRKTRPLSGCASSQSRNSWTPTGWFSVLATTGSVTVT